MGTQILMAGQAWEVRKPPFMTETEGGRKKHPKNAIIWHAFKLILTILNYFAYKYQLSQWENVKPKEKCLEPIG